MTALVLCCAFAYFVALPRFHQQIEGELGRILSTEVAQRIDAQVPNAVSVPAGEYRISLDDLQRGVGRGSDNLQVEGLALRAEGQDIVLRFAVAEASTEYRFTAAVSNEGYLRMTNLRGDGGILERIFPPDAIGNAVESSVNSYLQANGLYLRDVYLSGNDLVLQLGDR